MENREKKLLKNTAILTFGTVCTKGILFLITPIFTRWLSQEEYGMFDLMITYISLLLPLIVLNINEAVFRFLIKEENKKNQIISSALFVTLLGFIISSIVYFIFILLNTQIKEVATFFILLLFTEAINNFLMMILRGIKKLNLYTLANIIFVLTMILFAFIFVKILNLKLKGILIGYSFGYIISSIFIIVVAKIYKYIDIKEIKWSEAKKMILYAIPLIPNALSWWIMDTSDRTIVSIFLGASSNAILAVAHKIPNICQTIYNVFHLSWQENASESIEDKDRNEYYTKIFNKMIVTLISCSVCVLSVNFLIFIFLFEEIYFQAYYQVPILMFSIVFSMMAQFIGGIYIAQMKTKKNGVTTLMAALINIVVHAILISKIGIYAATISTLVAYCILFIIRYIDIKKVIDLKIEPKTLQAFIVLIYFIITTYINCKYINYANIILAILYFGIINRHVFLKLIGKMKLK